MPASSRTPSRFPEPTAVFSRCEVVGAGTRRNRFRIFVVPGFKPLRFSLICDQVIPLSNRTGNCTSFVTITTRKERRECSQPEWPSRKRNVSRERPVTLSGIDNLIHTCMRVCVCACTCACMCMFDARSRRRLSASAKRRRHRSKYSDKYRNAEYGILG